MPWYPDAVRKPLTTRKMRTMSSPRRVNLHTAVSDAESLFGYWQENKRGVYSHFYVREDGTVEQYVDTQYRAACDLDGNLDTISVETWDGNKMRPWTSAQVAALANLIRWIWSAHPTIPRTLARDNHKGSSSWGVSWHQLGSPYDRRAGYARYDRSDGGLLYTLARGKECPGRDRIGQIPGIFKAALDGGSPAPAPTPIPSPEEDDIMATPAERQALISELLSTKLGRSDVTVMQALQETVTRAHRPGDVTVDLLGRMLGSSGPAVGTAIQGTYIATQRLEAQTAALAALIEAGGREGLDVAALSRIADEAAEKALSKLGETLAA